MPFDWTRIVDHQRAALLRLVALVVAMIGESMSPQSYLAALRQLRPLESAARRLIVVAARECERPREEEAAEPKVRACGPHKNAAGGAKGRRTVGRFPLFDRRINPDPRPVRYGTPQIRLFDGPCLPSPPESKPRDFDPERLRRRLDRLQSVLENLPAQARRLALWRARHPGHVKRPMRPGRPPGYSARRRGDPVQAAMNELQTLSLYALEPG